MVCDRCGLNKRVTTWSYFDMVRVCVLCFYGELLHPNLEAARRSDSKDDFQLRLPMGV